MESSHGGWTWHRAVGVQKRLRAPEHSAVVDDVRRLEVAQAIDLKGKLVPDRLTAGRSRAPSPSRADAPIGAPADYEVWHIVKDPDPEGQLPRDDVQITGPVAVKSGQRFRVVPPGTFGATACSRRR